MGLDGRRELREAFQRLNKGDLAIIKPRTSFDEKILAWHITEELTKQWQKTYPEATLAKKGQSPYKTPRMRKELDKHWKGHGLTVGKIVTIDGRHEGYPWHVLVNGWAFPAIWLEPVFTF